MSNPTSAREDYPVMAFVEEDQLAISPDAKRALDEIDRLRALLAERDTPTPDPPSDTVDVHVTSETGRKVIYEVRREAVPVQEPVCVEVDISKALCRGLGGMPPCLTPNPRCPVCAVPNPESSPQ